MLCESKQSQAPQIQGVKEQAAPVSEGRKGCSFLGDKLQQHPCDYVLQTWPLRRRIELETEGRNPRDKELESGE